LQTRLDPDAPHLVLEQLAQWLNELEARVCRQATDVMVRF
jgi:hypothetical protein